MDSSLNNRKRCWLTPDGQALLRQLFEAIAEKNARLWSYRNKRQLCQNVTRADGESAVDITTLYKFLAVAGLHTYSSARDAQRALFQERSLASFMDAVQRCCEVEEIGFEDIQPHVYSPTEAQKAEIVQSILSSGSDVATESHESKAGNGREAMSLMERLLDESAQAEWVMPVALEAMETVMADPLIQARFEPEILQATLGGAGDLAALAAVVRQWIPRLEPGMAVPGSVDEVLRLFSEILRQRRLLVMLKNVQDEAIREVLSVPGMQARVLVADRKPPETHDNSINFNGNGNQVVTGTGNTVVQLDQSHNSGKISISF
ncbi:hypothetical protein [Leptolyngbya sp. CCY15150]|uniref:hypothetical protein n=1 Tax=Leptolyngbya sp. CCY15150 TaxID=2767772 RepID=UPI001951866E|nr:hypothetical protein [Leptolyngbya sp. CCY15150]